MLIIGASPRGGNHLLRALLDDHPELVLPPDEDYFLRTLLRKPLYRTLALLTSPERSPAVYRRLQKRGHLERVNAGRAKNSFGTEGVLDLDRYYEYVRTHHRRFSIEGMIRTHFGAMESALGLDPAGTAESARVRVAFCALQSDKGDTINIGRVLSSMYELRGVFVLRDPRSHFASKLGRKSDASLRRFCRRQNDFWRQIDQFEDRFGPALRVRFEDLVTNTEATMRRVCDFSGITFSESCVRPTQSGEATVSNSSFGTVHGVDQGVLTRYRDEVPPETIRYLESNCRPELFWTRSDAELPPVEPAVVAGAAT